VLRSLLPGIEQGLFPPPDFELISLDEAIAVYARIGEGTARRKQVISFAS
jgi:hypothetical protein